MGPTARWRHAVLAHWPAQERGTLVGAALALLGSFFVVSTWSLVILPVQRAFAMPADGEILLRQLPDVAGLLVILAVGVFGSSVSGARLLAAAAAITLPGALLATLAPSPVWLVLGASLMNVGRSVVSVAAFASVGSAIRHEGRRTSAFATLGAVPPVAFITGPVVGAWLQGWGDWRWVGICWCAGAALIGVAAWLSREVAAPASSPQERKEPWTPLVGGVMLVALVQCIGAIAHHGWRSGSTMAWGGGMLVAGAAWFMLARWLPRPSVDGRTLRLPGLMPILLVCMVAQCGDLWFYVAAIARFGYGLDPLQVSLAMLAAQIASLLGACLAGWLVHRIGLRFAGTLLLSIYAFAMFLSGTHAVERPLWTLIAVLCMAAPAEIGAGVCLSQTIMSRAPPGLDRQVSSYRSATMGVGNALAVLLVASSVGHAMSTAIRHEAEIRQVSPWKAEALAAAVRDNVPSGEIGRDLDLGVDQVEELRRVRRGVLALGFRTHGWVSGSVLAAAAIGFWLVRRDDLPAER
jgi:predicted MFS family arabinose efflux permease